MTTILIAIPWLLPRSMGRSGNHFCLQHIPVSIRAAQANRPQIAPHATHIACPHHRRALPMQSLGESKCKACTQTPTDTDRHRQTQYVEANKDGELIGLSSSKVENWQGLKRSTLHEAHQFIPEVWKRYFSSISSIGVPVKAAKAMFDAVAKCQVNLRVCCG